MNESPAQLPSAIPHHLIFARRGDSGYITLLSLRRPRSERLDRSVCNKWMDVSWLLPPFSFFLLLLLSFVFPQLLLVMVIVSFQLESGVITDWSWREIKNIHVAIYLHLPTNGHVLNKWRDESLPPLARRVGVHSPIWKPPIRYIYLCGDYRD